MKITFEMLTYISGPEILAEHIGSMRYQIKNIRVLSGESAFRENVLYIVNAKKGCLKEQIKELKRKAMDKSICVFISGADDLSDEIRCLFEEADCYAFFCTDLSEEEIQYKTEEAMSDLFRWDAAFNEILVRKGRPWEILALGSKYFPWHYMVFDLDLNVVYDSWEGAAEHNTARPTSNEHFQGLILDKAFHAAADKKGPFYYENIQSGTRLCHNLTVSGEYMARIVMDLMEQEKMVHSGAMELFEIFSAQIQKAVDTGGISFGRHSNDSAHILLRDLGNGKHATLEGCRSSFDGYGWKDEDFYTVVVFRFFRAEGWPSQLEITLPFMAAQFEKAIRDSCAAAASEEIIMLINRKSDFKSSGQGSFLPVIAKLVRDNACRAGISPVFTGCENVKAAIDSARAALDTGSELKPHLWYYLFDDLRLEYIAACCREKLPPDLICHGALNILESYDKAHGSELNRTLYVYLKNNMNMKASADEVFIHRTSFFHRMNHIKELTGIDLDDPDTVLSLMISYKIKGTDKWDKAFGQKNE